ncbi:MAG: hypothetical protein ACPL7K_01955 [Armatimonadota bacterium]
MMRTGLAAALALLLVLSAGAFAAPPRHDFPPVGAYQVLCGDFHMHTINSDGKLTTRERVEESYDRGYDVIAITDHGRPRPYRIAAYIGEQLGLVVIPGFETGVKDKEHYVCLGVPASFKPRDPHRWAEQAGDKTVFYQDEMSAIASAGGVLFQAHPPNEWREPTDWGVKNGIVVGVEVQNGYGGRDESPRSFNGITCYAHAFDWALQHNLTVFANTDAHGARRQGEQPVTLVFVTRRTADGVMEAIRARRTAAWFNGMLWGRQELLSDLVNAAVRIKRAGDTKLLLENRCPITFKATIDGKVFEIPAYKQVSVDWGGGDQARITWTNVWTSTKSNLETSVGL